MQALYTGTEHCQDEYAERCGENREVQSGYSSLKREGAEIDEPDCGD